MPGHQYTKPTTSIVSSPALVISKQPLPTMAKKSSLQQSSTCVTTFNNNTSCALALQNQREQTSVTHNPMMSPSCRITFHTTAPMQNSQLNTIYTYVSVTADIVRCTKRTDRVELAEPLRDSCFSFYTSHKPLQQSFEKCSGLWDVQKLKQLSHSDSAGAGASCKKSKRIIPSHHSIASRSSLYP